MRIAITTPLLFVVLLALPGMVGCEMERRVVRESGWNRLFTDSEWADNGGASGASGGINSKGYAVELGKYETSLEFRDASEMMRQARTEGGLADIWYSSDARWTRVYAGKFRNPKSDEAEQTLAKVKRAKINGRRVFEDAKIVALSSSKAQTLDPNDLRSLKGKGLFTLQIAHYDSSYGSNFRRTVEQKVKQMRADGEEAYYYHGPNRSLILINSWTRDEAFLSQAGQMDRYSNAVRAAQQKYPKNLHNGRPFTASDDPDLVKSQTSFLVPIR